MDIRNMHRIIENIFSPFSTLRAGTRRRLLNTLGYLLSLPQVQVCDATEAGKRTVLSF
jgi:hypothetical protein